MPYYGNPSTLASGLEAIKSIADPTLQAAYVASVDGFVTPALEGQLKGIFVLWPAPDDTDKNAISLLWHCRMIQVIYKLKFSQNTVGVPSELADWAKELDASTLQEIRSGSIMIDGAQQAGWAPRISVASPQFEARDDPVITKTIDDLLQRGIRI